MKSNIDIFLEYYNSADIIYFNNKMIKAPTKDRPYITRECIRTVTLNPNKTFTVAMETDNEWSGTFELLMTTPHFPMELTIDS